MTQVFQKLAWTGGIVTSEDGTVYRVVDGVFRRALALDPDLVSRLNDDPEGATAIIDQAVASLHKQFGQSSGGAFYVLEGAEPSLCTPMQYGGFFLERDREVLSKIGSPKILWIEARGEAYLDFVADLPADVLGWDPTATGVAVSAMRSMRTGTLLTTDGNANALLTREPSDV